ncbi:winged helix-turn-helix domain-containing protein [Myceligenerans cantabricum]
MLRFIFTPEDLSRVRLAPGPDPLWETLLSAHLVRELDGARIFGRWHRRVVPDLPRAALPYLSLTPPVGYSPDFLTPEAGSTDFAAGSEDMLYTSPDRIAAEIDILGQQQKTGAWMRDLAEGSPRVVRSLRASMAAFHSHALAPVWPRVRQVVEADRAARTQVLAATGVEAVLSTLHPTTTWADGVLTVQSRMMNGDVLLNGRGLTLVPSYFCWRMPITLANPDLAPVLVFPVSHDRHLSGDTVTNDSALAALLGRTRARALRELAGSASTTLLAERMDISPASASEHTTVLRQAGLVASQRDGRRVVHVLTELGHGLLEGTTT